MANAIPNLAASLAVAALAGVSYSGWLLLLLWVDDCRVTRTSIRSVTTKRKGLVVDFCLFVPKDSEGKKKKPGKFQYTKKRQKKKNNKRQTRWLNE